MINLLALSQPTTHPFLHHSATHSRSFASILRPPLPIPPSSPLHPSTPPTHPSHPISPLPSPLLPSSLFPLILTPNTSLHPLNPTPKPRRRHPPHPPHRSRTIHTTQHYHPLIRHNSSRTSIAATFSQVQVWRIRVPCTECAGVDVRWRCAIGIGIVILRRKAGIGRIQNDRDASPVLRK